VVLADDDPLVHDVVARALGHAGYRVVAGSDGAEALELVSRHAPGVVILDVRMPGLDGLEVTRRLRAASGTRALPVLLITAEPEAAHLECGADAFLRKPFTIAALCEQVDALCASPGR
jgi:CheY-like chemotaxis protein